VSSLFTPLEEAAARTVARRTVAVLIDYVDHLSSGYDTQLRSGFDDACVKHDVNLVVVVGRPLESLDALSATHNEVYRLVHPDCTDGVVLVSAGLGSACGADRLRQLCDTFRPMALCSLGLGLPGVPSVVIDNHLGMEAVIEHIIGEHGCRHVAFIGGPQNNVDAAARLQVYQRVLARYGLPFEPQLVVLGDFTFSTGITATNVLLERGARFDAIVAANDGMALGAIEALRARGQRVPGDVRVAGFDDLTMARFSNPPLTTARQPFERMASLAIDLIVAQWEGESVPDQTCLPVEVLARRSCGCHFRELPQHPHISTKSSVPAGTFLRENYAPLLNKLNQLLAGPGIKSTIDAAQLLEALQAELAGQQDAFVSSLDELLDKAGGHNECFDDVQTAVSFLRDAFNAIGAVQFEDLWDSSRRAIAIANTRSLSEQRASLERNYQGLLRCGERFSSVPDLPSLKRALAKELPLVPINNVLFALCVAEQQTELEPFFGLRDGQPLELPTSRLPETQLLAHNELYSNRRHTSFVIPLTFETQYLGVVVLESQSGLGVCGMLREQVSFAVKSVSFHQEIVGKTALHERSVQERVAATARMESLSAMAGGVAHDLNSALSPIVALPDVILGLVDKLVVGPSPEAQRLRHYVETIKSAAHRATQTIRDLMTLGRQGRTHKAPLDLNWIVASCLSAEPLLEMNAEPNRIDISLKLYPTPLLVVASQYHMERAISNLVRNALEAIGEFGALSVQTCAVNFLEPILGHETIAPGQYAVVVVSDTGPGIPADLIGRVFEPFFTNKQLRDSSGSGLGLSIVHGVVKEHAGFVDVTSEKGSGTTFTLYFPLAQQSPVVATVARPDSAEGAKPAEGIFESEGKEAPSAIQGRIDAA